MNNQEIEHIINIRAFISELKEIDENGAIFKNNVDQLIESAKTLINDYNSKNKGTIITNKRSNKSTKLGIDTIEVIDLPFNQDNALLLKVSAYKTNLVDGYYQRLKENDSSKDEYKFKRDDRICSDTYFLILYPIVKSDSNTLKCQEYWHVFLYVDPSKESYDMKVIAKYIMSTIIKRPIKNIKAHKFIEELRKHDIIQSAEITLSSFSESDDEEKPGYLADYAIECKVRKQKTIRLSGMKIEDAIAAYEDTSFTGTYNKRQLKFINANQQVYQATQEFHNKMRETFEDSFNYTIAVTPVEVNSKKIFETDFIKEKIEGLLTRYTIG